MGRISDEDVARVRDATDLVTVVSERVPLRQKGRLFWGNCPFHGEKTPSFKVDPATQLWHCFGCGAGGDVYGFVMRIENVDFPDAVRMLADRARIEIRESEGGLPRSHRERLYAVLEEAARFYHRTLTSSRDPGATSAREYLAGRGFGSDVAKRWVLGYAPGRGALVKHLTGLGYSPEEMLEANLALRGPDAVVRDRFYERVMFPIVDVQGRHIAFGGRVIGTGEPKYLNTNDTPVFHKSANLYGIDRAKASITATGDAIVVEGYTDVIALHESGLGNAVATLGTALTQQHVRLLRRFARRIIYLFDGDEAGIRAAERAVEFVDRTITPEAGRNPLDLLVCALPSGLDPADYAHTHGIAELERLLSQSEPLLKFAVERRLSRWDLDRPEERARALTDAAQVLAPVKDSILADDYASLIADRLFADFTTVKRAIERAVPSSSSTREAPSEETASPQEGLRPPVTGEEKAQRAVVGLAIRCPELRAQARELLALGLLADVYYRRMLEAVVEADLSAGTEAVLDAVEARVEGSRRVLEESDPLYSGMEGQALFDALVLSLKEFDLERRIAAGRAHLKDEETIKDGERYDELFREVSAMQRELDALRRHAVLGTPHDREE